MVDIYGTLVASRILVPNNELAVQDELLKLSTQRKFIEDGSQPFPIYTAVRHEIPLKAVSEKDKTEKTQDEKTQDDRLENLGSTGDTELFNPPSIPSEKKQQLEQRAKDESWFQWFELTPYPASLSNLINRYYIGCEELEAWIPTYGMGRQYHNGINVSRTPELKLPIILGYLLHSI
jgi:phospholipase A2